MQPAAGAAGFLFQFPQFSKELLFFMRKNKLLAVHFRNGLVKFCLDLIKINQNVR